MNAMLEVALWLTTLSLDAPKFRQREAATTILRDCGDLAYGAVQYGRCHLAAEGKGRCRALLRPLFWTVCYRKAKSLPAPWIYLERPQYAVLVASWERYLEWAKHRGFHNDTADWTAYREATRLWAADCLYRGASEMAVRQALADMERQESVYKGEETPYPTASGIR